MLESVLSNILTQILGQYLHGIDRNSVTFGAWSGLVELRGVALKAEALAVLFETLGMDLPVTVEAGFIGLLRVVVPWKSIGSTPVRIEMEGINIIARPVRDDGADDSAMKQRELRIKRAKLNTDDAVREAAWSVSNEDSGKKTRALSWLVGDELLAKIVANIQVELKNIVLRFEDPFSNELRPYAVSMHCESLRAVSANDKWEEVFVEDVSSSYTRKVVSVKGFHVDWQPLKTKTSSKSGLPSEVAHEDLSNYNTPDALQTFFDNEASDSHNSSHNNRSRQGPSNIISPINGSLHLSLNDGLPVQSSSSVETSSKPGVDVDIRFPNVSVKLDDVQYTSLVQTSLYFSKLGVRGFRPKTPKERWIWAIEQLLPGFRERRARLLSFTAKGVLKQREERYLYSAYRMSILKSRRTGIEEPKDVAEELEKMEESLPYERVILYRDIVDEQVEKEAKTWSKSVAPQPSKGTTMKTFWSMLGYTEENSSAGSSLDARTDDVGASVQKVRESTKHDVIPQGPKKTLGDHSHRPELTLRVGFHLREGSVCLSEGGYPGDRKQRLSMILKDLVLGLKVFSNGGLALEGLLGTVEAWDIVKKTRMVYSRIPRSRVQFDSAHGFDPNESSAEYEDTYENLFMKQKCSSYPESVKEAIQAIQGDFGRASASSDSSGDESGREGLGVVSSNRGDHSEVPRSDTMGDLSSAVPSQTADLDAWTAQGSEAMNAPGHRVTEAEFYGKGRGEQQASLAYIAAIQISKRPIDTEGTTSAKMRTKINAAVGQLEAVVDGPSGSFLWGLRFWKPKGLKQDPIMAFLGAAAGARIAELRMEIKETLLANKLPLEVDSIIRAPRFIVPGRTPQNPAIVVNLGTLGIRTSGNTEQSSPSTESGGQKPPGHYTNYALSLDDLGIYIAPTEEAATSSTRNIPRNKLSQPNLCGVADAGSLNSKSIERLIRPFSMRYFVQVLRDRASVQVAAGAQSKGDSASRIAKIRLRGQVPGLWLMLSQESCKHLLNSLDRWTSAFRVERDDPELHSTSSLVTPEHEAKAQSLLRTSDGSGVDVDSEIISDVILASYDCRLAVDNVSLELRDVTGQRLVTALASGMCASLVKTKNHKVESDFTLKRWTVTDGSRGSTAPFRRLAYAGITSDLRGVSPPRSSSSRVSPSDERVDDPSFVNISHVFDLNTREQSLRIHFLSLNLIFVRETFLKIVFFFDEIRKNAFLRDHVMVQAPKTDEEVSSTYTSDTCAQLARKPDIRENHERTEGAYVEGTSSSPNSLKELKQKQVNTTNVLKVGAVFDGFRIQLVSTEGAICTIEMRDFIMRARLDTNRSVTSSGEVRFFAVDDLTAPVREHQSLLRYERANDAIERMLLSSGKNNSAFLDLGIDGQIESSSPHVSDGWELIVSENKRSKAKFKARIQGIEVRYLARFSIIMSNYFGALSRKLNLANSPSSTFGVIEYDSGADSNWSFAKSVDFEVDIQDIVIRIPRHSGNVDEAVIVRMPTVHIWSVEEPSAGLFSCFRVSFSGMNASVQYRLQDEGKGSLVQDSAFLKENSAELQIEIRQNMKSVYGDTVQEPRVEVSPWIRCRFSVFDQISIGLCEAQYTVLYFVLTENFFETVEDNSSLLGFEDVFCTESKSWESGHGEGSRPSAGCVQGQATEYCEEPISPVLKTRERLASNKQGRIVQLSFNIPSMKTTLSRGWDISNNACRIVESVTSGITGNLEYGSAALIFEASLSLESLSDLREEHTTSSRTFASPLVCYSESDSESNASSSENLTLSYTRIPFRKPSIMLTLTNMQVKVVPELCRDLTYLAVPGWPFLSTSAFPPPIRYLGRTVTINFTKSQLLLCADEFENDRRGMVLSGEFLTKVEWMPVTGEKSFSLHTSGLKVSLHHDLSDMDQGEALRESSSAKRYLNSGAIILYPCDSVVEYVGPNIDDKGRRVHISADSMLCRVNIAETPDIFSVFKRLGRLDKSYLSERDWRQITEEGQDPSKSRNLLNPKEKTRNIASRNLSVSYKTPAARVLFTDQTGDRFVPILELNLRNVSVRANVPYLVHCTVKMSMDLFSREKGLWEPGIEPWKFEASMSRGNSGSQAFVVKSDNRLNINVTPATIQGTKQVVNSLRNVRSYRENVSSDEEGANSRHRRFGRQGHMKSKDPLLKHKADGHSEPSVAAFHIRNELGVPIQVLVPMSSRKSTILHLHELEIFLPTERLLPSDRSKNAADENAYRHDALKVIVGTSGFFPLELSAAEVGSHEALFSVDSDARKESGKTSYSPMYHQLPFVWDVTMSHGVPICTIRSPFRLLNETNTDLEVCMPVPVASVASRSSPQGPDHSFISEQHTIRSTIAPGKHFSVPTMAVDRPLRIRPILTASTGRKYGTAKDGWIENDLSSDFLEEPEASGEQNERIACQKEQAERNGQITFDWCVPLKNREWMRVSREVRSSKTKRVAASYLDPVKARPDRYRQSRRGTMNANGIEEDIVRCQCVDSSAPDYFISVVPSIPGVNSGRYCGLFGRLDISFQAPLRLSNLLPGRISYRISADTSSGESWGEDGFSASVIGAGVIEPLGVAHIHCVDCVEMLGRLSVAFENAPSRNNELGYLFVNETSSSVPISFGPSVPLGLLLNGQIRTLSGCAERTAERTAEGGREKFWLGDTVHVSLSGERPPVIEFFAPFWIRNRSDTDLEVFSRKTPYGRTSIGVRARGRRRGYTADRYLCFDGPYLALRNLNGAGNSSTTRTDSWNCPTDLGDVTNPLQIAIPRRSLVLDVRPSKGFSKSTCVVTIRNSAFIINNSGRPIEWCQSSVLGAHGNCPARFVQLLEPYSESPIHWDTSSSHRSINIRLADGENRSSDWIWSPPLPIFLENAGEVSAKMYRPKTQEQYIARVVSSSLDDDSHALIVLPEDRQNPPYRIINSSSQCVAFYQYGSQERPWLLRPGKSTRYSWDDPLAPAHKRKLQIEVIDVLDAPPRSSSASMPFDVAVTDGGSVMSGASTRADSSSLQSKSPSGRAVHQKALVNIDIVSDNITKLDSSDTSLVYGISMDGATKCVTFRDLPNGQTKEIKYTEEHSDVSEIPIIVEQEDSVPTVGWDDISMHTSSGVSARTFGQKLLGNSEESRLQRNQSDFPRKKKSLRVEGNGRNNSMDIDVAFFLASAGMSVVTLEPAELLYAHASGLHLNFEAYDSLQCFAFQVRNFQIDNQLENPPYPVTLWTAVPEVSEESPMEQVLSEPNREPEAFGLEFKRVPTDSGILMLKSFRAAICPLYLMIDEAFVAGALAFIEESNVDALVPDAEVLSGEDGEHVPHVARLQKIRSDQLERQGLSEESKTALSGIKSAQRVYVEDFKLYPFQIVLSSSVSRAPPSSRFLAYSSSLRPFLGFLMNVENCEFDFSALELHHLFDPITHFASLIWQYYEAQFSSQRVKLLTSNSLVGNPAALFDSVAVGARDFFGEPTRAKGSGNFLSNVGRGSKSLLTHTVGGLVGSFSGIPRAVSSGLESAVGDQSYLAERERIRGSQLAGGRRAGSSNPAQGAVTGAISFVHGISSGVTGLFKEPVQGAMQGGASGFLRGMGKGIVGGVVKPVAGAMDLIAEPAAGLSKQINENAQRQRGRGNVSPLRPPRTFRGEDRKLVPYDLHMSTGEALYKAVQISCGVSYAARLIDWVELSDRSGRGDSNSSEWVWKIVRTYSRAMPGSRKDQLLKEHDPGTLQDRAGASLQNRPEKTRAALLTYANIIIVTLDCKLVLMIPLWDDASFSIEFDGKDIIFVTTMSSESEKEGGSSLLGEAQSLFAAPWDASSATRRRKPDPGEVVRDRIACGSISARESLAFALRKIFEALKQRYIVEPVSLRPHRSSSGFELEDLSSVNADFGAIELAQTNKSDAADGASNVFVLPMRAPADSFDKRGYAPRETSDNSKDIFPRMEDIIRRLSMSGTCREMDAKRSVRVIVANELHPALELLLQKSTLESGYWRTPVPQTIQGRDAAMFELDSGSSEELQSVHHRSGKGIKGSVVFRVSGESTRFISGNPNARIEFFVPLIGSPSYSTESSNGLVASYERGAGTHATVVFKVSFVNNEASPKRHSGSGSDPRRNSSSFRPRVPSLRLFGSSKTPSAQGDRDSSSRNSSNTSYRSVIAVDDQALAQLVELGFEPQSAANALRKSGNNLVKAVDLLTK